MKEFFEQIATDNSFIFVYAPDDYANLFDDCVDKDQPVLVLRPVISSEDFNAMGTSDEINFSGSFSLSLSSDLDTEDYNYRYNNYIKPISAEALEKVKQAFKCSDEFYIKNFQSVEVINSLDFNLDGISVTYQIEQVLNV